MYPPTHIPVLYLRCRFQARFPPGSPSEESCATANKVMYLLGTIGTDVKLGWR